MLDLSWIRFSTIEQCGLGVHGTCGLTNPWHWTYGRCPVGLEIPVDLSMGPLVDQQVEKSRTDCWSVCTSQKRRVSFLPRIFNGNCSAYVRTCGYPYVITSRVIITIYSILVRSILEKKRKKERESCYIGTYRWQEKPFVQLTNEQEWIWQPAHR